MLLMGEEAQGGFGSQNGSTSPEPRGEGGGRRFGGEEERDTARRGLQGPLHGWGVGGADRDSSRQHGPLPRQSRSRTLRREAGTPGEARGDRGRRLLKGWLQASALTSPVQKMDLPPRSGPGSC